MTYAERWKRAKADDVSLSCCVHCGQEVKPSADGWHNEETGLDCPQRWHLPGRGPLEPTNAGHEVN